MANSKKPYNKNRNRDNRKSEGTSSGRVVMINDLWKDRNDPGWYNRLTSLFKDSILISFFNQLGAKYKFNRNTELRVPGIMGLITLTTPGNSSDINSPVSMAAIAMYEAVRKKLNKPISDYEPADMWMVQFASSDLFSQYSNMVRCLKIINTWDATNLYAPRALLQQAYVPEEHFDEFYNDLIDNMADYRYKLNLLITKAMSFIYMPEDYAIVRRHSWLFGSIFRDHKSSSKAQLYMHVKPNYWLFNEDKYDTGTAVLFKDFWPEDESFTGPYTFQRYLDAFAECIEALRNSSSVRTIIADMRQAFSDRAEFGMGYIDERQYIEFNDSDEVLSQIENTEVLPWYWDRYGSHWSPLGWDTIDITQDPDFNSIIWNPKWPFGPNVADNLITKHHILNMHWENPSDDDKMVATRGKFTIYGAASTDTGSSCYTKVGSDICIGVYILTNPDDPENSFGFKQHPIYTMIRGTNQETTCQLLSELSTFDWAPAYYLYAGQPSNPGTMYPVQDLDNYTIIDDTVVDRANLTALLSMWSIPEHGEMNIG